MLEIIKKLRNITGVSIADIKKALEDAGGDEKKAMDLLRVRGTTKAEKRFGRETKAGIVEAYVHSNKRVGTLVELLCETDFVARSDKFRELAHEIALQIASMNPQYLNMDQIPEEVLKNERSIYKEEISKTGKPADVVGQVIEGKLKKYCQEVCLLDQLYVKDQNLSVKELVSQYIAKLGENIKIGNFARFEI